MTECCIPVDAICTSCKKTAVKNERTESPDDLPHTFQDVCHQCQQVTYWNVVRVLRGLIDLEEDGRVEEA